jgi:stage II sporulation protein D
LAGSFSPGATAQNEACVNIKVAIGINPKSFTIGATGDFFLIDPASGKELLVSSKEIKCQVSDDSAKYYAVYIDTFYSFDDANGFGQLLCKRFPEDPGKNVCSVEKGLFRLEIGKFKSEDEAKLAISSYLADIDKADIVQTDASGIRLGDSLLMRKPANKGIWQLAIVKPLNGGIAVYNGRRYREKVSLYSTNGRYYVVNELKFEDYVKGVVPSEMPASWPLEALKVQALCARTFAYAYCRNPESDVYNINSTDVKQVYLGLDQETERSNQAVTETTGMLITYNKNPINAYFHSTSGGMTENSENVWSSALPYCKAVESPGEEESPHYTWMRFISSEELKSDLADDTGDIGEIVSLTTIRKGASGRIKTCEIKGTKGSKVLDGGDVAYLLGLRSSWFDLVFITGGAVACGRGWGHGVGMSQYGSKAMAVAGKKYVEIVKHYYRGVEVTKWY